MKITNRKVLTTLLGVMLAAPFLVIASMVLRAASLANTMRVDVFCVGLVLASVAVRIIDGHLAVRTAQTEPGRGESSGNTNLQKSSMVGA